MSGDEKTKPMWEELHDSLSDLLNETSYRNDMGRPSPGSAGIFERANQLLDACVERVSPAAESVEPSKPSAPQAPTRKLKPGPYKAWCEAHRQAPPCTECNYETVEAEAPLLGCMDCGKPYRDFPLDVVLPDSEWALINPKLGGVLCATCIVARAEKIPGVTVVRAHLESVEAEAPTPPHPYGICADSRDPELCGDCESRVEAEAPRGDQNADRNDWPEPLRSIPLCDLTDDALIDWLGYCANKELFWGSIRQEILRRIRLEANSAPSVDTDDKRVVFEFTEPGPCSACGDGDTAQKFHKHAHKEAAPSNIEQEAREWFTSRDTWAMRWKNSGPDSKMSVEDQQVAILAAFHRHMLSKEK